MFQGPRNTRKDAKFSELEIGRFAVSGQEALVFNSRVMPEIDEQTQLAGGCAQIIQNLRAVLIAQIRNRLDLENYFSVADKIRVECLNQCAATVLQCLRWFRQKWNSLKFELDLQASIIKPARESRSPYLDKRQSTPR
jgi:hypothetical protein